MTAVYFIEKEIKGRLFFKCLLKEFVYGVPQ